MVFLRVTCYLACESEKSPVNITLDGYSKNKHTIDSYMYDFGSIGQLASEN